MEYKENTVGWHLSRLKEPLRSLCFRDTEDCDLQECVENMSEALYKAFTWSESEEGLFFWSGARSFFGGDPRPADPNSAPKEFWQGFDMAKECAPDQPLIDIEAGKLKGVYNEDGDLTGLTGSPVFLTSQEILDLGKNPIKLPKAVEGYEPPVPSDSYTIKRHKPMGRGLLCPPPDITKPIQTIEERHDKELKDLQARVDQLETQIQDLIEVLKKKFEKQE